MSLRLILSVSGSNLGEGSEGGPCTASMVEVVVRLEECL